MLKLLGPSKLPVPTPPEFSEEVSSSSPKNTSIMKAINPTNITNPAKGFVHIIITFHILAIADVIVVNRPPDKPEELSTTNFTMLKVLSLSAIFVSLSILSLSCCFVKSRSPASFISSKASCTISK